MAEFEKKQMPEFDMKKMAENIRKLRERKGLSPREFADQLGIHVQRVYELEREDQQHVPSTDLLWRISTTLDTSLDQILSTGQASRMTFTPRDFWEYAQGIEEEIMKVEWKYKSFIAERYVVLRFFSLLHQTDSVLRFFIKTKGGTNEDLDKLFNIQRFFKNRLKIFYKLIVPLIFCKEGSSDCKCCRCN